jgi:hypothetical protein
MTAKTSISKAPVKAPAPSKSGTVKKPSTGRSAKIGIHEIKKGAGDGGNPRGKK